MKYRSAPALLAGICLAFTSTGCLKWYSDDVAMGVARLTVRNTGAVLALVVADTQCGFDSPDVLQAAAVDGPVGGRGEVTWTVQDCVIDLGDLHEITRDCNDVITYAGGKVTVSATKTVAGRLTGNPELPVVPEDPDAALITITGATFSRFLVTKSNSKNSLTIKSGGLSAVIQPKLAVSSSNGACSIVTPNISFRDITYLNAELHVVTPDREFDVEAPTSSLSAENGTYDDNENALRGFVTVWDKRERVKGGKQGLDPDYDAAAFESSYTCNQELQTPVSFSCDLQPALAEGTARLSVRTLGIIGTLANADPTCGFDSGNASLQLNGTTGYDGGSAAFSINTCVLDYPQPVEVMTDCNGVTTFVQGRAVVTGTKTVYGYLTGDPQQPAVPTSWQPAQITLSAQLSGFEVWTTASEKSLQIRSGNLSGSITPRTALDAASGACTISTPVGEFQDVRLRNADARLKASGSSFDLRVDASQLHAVNGSNGSLTNYLAGTISTDGASVELPFEAKQPVLDPDFEPIAFAASYACLPGAIIPAAPEECTFRPTLAQAAARLMVKTVGVLTKHIDEDMDCGLGDFGNIAPTTVEGEANETGRMTWTVQDCALGGAPEVVAQYCDGTQTFIEGTAVVHATKSVTGTLVLGYPPILPRDRESAHFDFHDVAFNDFLVYDLAPGETTPESTLTLHAGRMSAYVTPITGESESEPGAYFVKTPLADFADVSALGIEATLRSGAKQFHVVINSSDLDAFNGSYRYRTNEIGGSMRIDGQTLSVPVVTDAQTLNPDYEQAAFDASYVCKEDLAELVPASTFLP